MNAEQKRIREIADAKKHTVDLSGYELRIIRRASAMVCHRASARCPSESPHLIAECGEFDHSLPA